MRHFSTFSRGLDGLIATFGNCWETKQQQPMDPFQKLCQACSDGTLGIVTEMMSIKGLDVNQTNETEETPLHLACERGFCSLVDALFTNQGLDVNRGNQFGTTPLSIACQHNRVGVVQLLLARTDIQVNKCDRQERTPSHLLAPHKSCKSC